MILQDLRQIDLNRGVPPMETIPSAELGRITARLAEAQPHLFQYSPIGGYQGDPQLREAIARQFGEKDAEGIFVGNGSLQLLDLLAATLIAEGPESVLVEAPTYDRAIGIFRRHGARIEPVPVDGGGLVTDRLEALLRRRRYALLYTIPDFQNPSGATLTLQRRRELAWLADRYDLTIVEDIPYRDLRYRGTGLPLLRQLVSGEGRVVTLASLSKTLSPGLRIGYALCGSALAARLARRAENTYLSPSPLCQAVAAAALGEGLVERNVARTRRLLGPRCDRAVGVARELFGDALLAEPEGGYFLSLYFSAGVDETRLLEQARGLGLLLARGSAFLPGRGQREDSIFLRVPFQGCDPDLLAEGLQILSRLVDRLGG